MTPYFSVVIPVHNEKGNIEPLHRELLETLAELGKPFEIIYVNDGSTDSTLDTLRELPRAVVIDLTRRFGKATALTAGFRHATGSIFITLDGDGQNDPRDIPVLLNELETHDLDMVAGWRTDRKDRKVIRLITRTGRALRKAFLDDRISDSGCALRVYRREAIESLDLQGEMDRYIPALLIWKGFRIGEHAVNDRARKYGKSKYGTDKAVRAFIDLVFLWFLYKYSQRPLHFFGYMSIGSFALGFCTLFITLYDRLLIGTHLNRDGWFFLTIFFLINAIMLFSFGIVIDVLFRTYHHTSAHEKRYYVRRIYTQ